MNNQTNEATTSDAGTEDVLVDQMHRHILGLLDGMRSLEPERAARAFREILRANKTGVLTALEENILESRHSVVAQIEYLRDIERTAMELLEVAPDYDDVENGNELAVMATRIFSRVRFILPKEHEAGHREDDEDEDDVEEAAADEPSGTRLGLDIDISDNDAGAETEVGS